MKFRLKIWRDEYMYATNDTGFDPITIDDIKYLFNQFNIRLKNDDINHHGSFYVIKMNTTTGIIEKNFIRLSCKLNSFAIRHLMFLYLFPSQLISKPLFQVSY